VPRINVNGAGFTLKAMPDGVAAIVFDFAL